MSQNISHDIQPHAKKRIKDSLILIVIFCIGLAGLCYILHMSASNNESTGYYIDESRASSGEVIYFTSSK